MRGRDACQNASAAATANSTEMHGHPGRASGRAGRTTSSTYGDQVLTAYVVKKSSCLLHRQPQARRVLVHRGGRGPGRGELGGRCGRARRAAAGPAWRSASGPFRAARAAGRPPDRGRRWPAQRLCFCWRSPWDGRGGALGCRGQQRQVGGRDAQGAEERTVPPISATNRPRSSRRSPWPSRITSAVLRPAGSVASAHNRLRLRDQVVSAEQQRLGGRAARSGRCHAAVPARPERPPDVPPRRRRRQRARRSGHRRAGRRRQGRGRFRCWRAGGPRHRNITAESSWPPSPQIRRGIGRSGTHVNSGRE